MAVSRLTGGFIPPTAPLDPSVGGGRDTRDRDLDLWNYLNTRPAFPISIPSGSANKVLINRQSQLIGWSFRDTGGTGAVVELLDGADATGELLGEINLSVLPGLLGLNTDTQVTASATGTTASINAALAGVAGQTTFVSGFVITGSGATAAVTGIATLAGTISGTMNFDWGVPAGATVPAAPLVVEFTTPVAASGLNQAITLTVPASGAGATAIACSIHGFQRSALVVAAGQPANGSAVTQSISPLLARGGLFMRVVSGTVTGAVWVKA